MLAKRVVWVLVAVMAAGFVALFAAYVPRTETYKNCAQERQSKNEQHSQIEPPGFIVCSARAIRANETLVNVASTFAVALFTIVLAISTVYLWDAGEKSARGLTRLERAWVLMDVIEPHDVPIRYQLIIDSPYQSFAPSIEFTWINAGKSPAFVLATDARFFLLLANESLPEKWEVEAVRLPQEEAMIPSGQRRMKLRLQNARITPEDWNNLNWRKAFLYLRTYVSYRDVFGEIHETRFCAKFSDFPEHNNYYQPQGGREYNRIT